MNIRRATVTRCLMGLAAINGVAYVGFWIASGFQSRPAR
jgi:hypothetical protein